MAEIKARMFSALVGMLLGIVCTVAIGYLIYSDAEATASKRIGQLTATVGQLESDQQRARAILDSAGTTVQRLRQLVSLYFPGE